MRGHRAVSAETARAAGLVAGLVVGALALPSLAAAQAPADSADSTDARAEVLAVVYESLERISEEDMAGFADLMLEGGAVALAGTQQGETFHRVRTPADVAAGTPEADLVERGFEPEVRISGPMAMVWLPYDFYGDGEWSHCGVDVFTLLRTGEGWRIATITYSVLQPPDCRPHPDGPPGG